MVPPSDSFTHAANKLSPATRAAISGLASMPLPPPAYTADPPPIDSVEHHSDSDLSDASDWTGPPVTIHINASISIEGTSNQVALPPHPSSRSLRLQSDISRIAQGLPSDYHFEIAHLPSSNTLSSDARHLAAATDRAEQIADAVMTTLKDAGVLTGTVTPQRRLDICVDASVTVKGERNIVTTNVPLNRRMKRYDSVPESGFGGTEGATNATSSGGLLNATSRSGSSDPTTSSKTVEVNKQMDGANQNHDQRVPPLHSQSEGTRTQGAKRKRGSMTTDDDCGRRGAADEGGTEEDKRERQRRDSKMDDIKPNWS